MSHKKRQQEFKVSMLEGLDCQGDQISNWCCESKEGALYAYCRLCLTSFKVCDRGKDAVVKHARNKAHLKATAKYRDASGNLINISEPRTIEHHFQKLSGLQENIIKNSARIVPLTHEDKVTSAEAIWCTTVACAHLPFQLSNTMSETFPVMFPDSKIASDFKCKRTKTSQIISDGLGPYFRCMVENEIRNHAVGYTVEIDEATTASHWRQLDILVRYFSNTANEVVVSYLASFTLGSANSDKLLDCLKETLAPLYFSKLLQISSDGPNVMKALHTKARQDINKSMVDISTCNIHKVHNAFSAALEEFGTNLETLGIDLFYLFKYSPVRREEFEAVQKKLALKKHVFIRHVSSRWLTLEDVNLRLIEQIPALKKYFLETLTNKEREKGRVNRICQILKDKMLEVEMLFLKSVMEIFTRFTCMFQTVEPLIHILYDEMSTLVLTLLRRFVKQDVIGDKRGSKLCNVDVTKSENLLKFVDIGHSAKNKLIQLSENKRISERERLEFNIRACKFFTVAVHELSRTLPLKNTLLRDLQAIHPIARDASWTVAAIHRIAVSIGVFPREEIDRVDDEWKMYQAEEIPNDWFMLNTVVHNDETSENTDQDSGTNEVNTSHGHGNGTIYVRIDHYWRKVFDIKTMSGTFKYPFLTKLVKMALSLSHGNADVERGFSANKLILTTHRSALSTECISGVRMTSSFMAYHGGQPKKLPITSELLGKVRRARQAYKDRTARKNEAQKRKLEQEIETKSFEDEQEKALKQKKRGQELLNTGMEMLAKACKNTNITKIEAANAILQSAKETIALADEKLQQRAKKKK